MENRYLHLFDSVQDLNNYITNDYEEPFVALTGGTRLDFNIPLIINNNGHEYVDLGLPSGTLWATCNVGSDNPEDIGDYFAWGEVEPKETYTKENYKWYSNGSYNNMYEIELSDDAANYNWGGDWIMPSRAQWNELIQNTTRTAITINDKDCYKFEVENGNFIIFPKSGYISGSSKGRCGSIFIDYWRKDRTGFYSGNEYEAWILYLSSIDSTSMSGKNSNRYIGCNCRPVLTPTRAIIS